MEILFSKTAKYILNVVYKPKKSILKLNSYSNIHILSSFLGACFLIILPSKHMKCSLRQRNSWKFLGEHAPEPP